MKCPVCVEPELVMSERQGVEIDYCPKCRGVWLDRGELDKVIERAGGGAAPPPGEPGRRSREDPEAVRRSRKRGFLGELFDFD